MLFFNGTIQLTGLCNSDELSCEYQLLNAYTDEPVIPVEVERRLPIPAPPSKLGGCTVHFVPRLPWRAAGSVEFTGSINGSPVTPYILLFYIRDTRGHASKHRVSLEP